MPDPTPKKLARAAGVGFERMKHFRTARMKMMSQYVSRFYSRQNMGESADKRAFPLNLMYQAVTTMVPNLVYNDPKARVSTNYMDYREYSSILELAINHLSNEIRLRDTLRMAITDAIFMCGWIKDGIGVSGQTLDLDGALHDVGQPYCDRVDPDDMTVDPMARTMEEVYFIGNRFRAPRSSLLDSGLFKKDVVEGLPSRWDYPSWPEVTRLSQNAVSQDWVEQEDLVEYVDLVEIYLPEQQAVVTLPYDPEGAGSKFLREVEYEGPETGPYHQLGFSWVPDNIMPVAPAMIWYDLHMMSNRIARKIARQAERQKSVLAYEASAWEDAADIVESNDGESVRVDDVDKIREITFGGAREDGYAYLEWSKQQFSEAAMNMDLISGNKSNEPTATQAELLQANSTVRLADMQNLVYDFTAKIMKDMMFFLHTDPLIELPLIKREQGLDRQVAYTPEMREGDWLDYNVSVVPYSMGRQDPNVKVRRLVEYMGNVIPAIANAFQMLGPAFNIEAALELSGREMGITELSEIINSQNLAAMTQRMKELIEAGVPLDAKAIRMITNPIAGGATGTADFGGNTQQPGQPNPQASLPQGFEGMETNQMQQETAAELQGTY